VKSRQNKDLKNVLRLRSTFHLPEHKAPVELDDLDRAIIEAQQEDPFFSYSDLAENWDVTGATVRNRIKRLKTNGVLDVVTVINPYKVGFDTFAQIGIKLKANASPQNLLDRFQDIEGVSGIIMVAGNFDFFVTYVCRNLEEFRKFITQELREIPEIESFEIFIGLDLYERKFLAGVIR
jgi:Lrp/AsnC family transcriptional regulator, regulator for asnA, asnC and gidA